MSSLGTSYKKASLPELTRHGVAVEHFPKYINLTENLHCVDVLLVSLVVRGKGWHLMTDSIYEETGHCIGITNYGQAHSIITDEAGMEIYNIYLDPRTHPLPRLPLPLQNTLQVLFADSEQFTHRLNRSLHFKINNPELMIPCVEAMRQEMTTSKGGNPEMMSALFSVFLISCCRSAQQSGIQSSVSDKDPVPNWVLQVCQQLDETYASPISLAELAETYRLSQGYMCRTFKRHVGMTLIDYLINRRIQAAKRELRNTPRKVLDIAMDSGFRDLSHFNRSFKEKTGQAPLHYRKGHEGHGG